MYNLLIVEGDLIQSHFLVNTVCKEIQNVRLYNVVSTGKEAIDMIKGRKVDLIILNLELPDMNGIEIIDFISKNNIIEYKSSIIVITSEIKLLAKTIGNNYIFD